MVPTKKPSSQWLIKRYDTNTGDIINEVTATAGDDGRVPLALGELNPDTAFQLFLIQSSEK